ncbi:MAG: hypothetical protein P8P30_01105 [Rickettsiales bacterium]|nr:hypothetical protein [Rickettsiales bacterium]
MSFKFKLIIAILAISTLIRFVGPELTEVEKPAEPIEHASTETRLQHYEGEVVATTEMAKALLNKKIMRIGKIIAKPKLEGADLESIHEHSYSLETAIDKIRADKGAEEKIIDAADEAIQALHYASENHEEAVTREWFGKLVTASGKL